MNMNAQSLLAFRPAVSAVLLLAFSAGAFAQERGKLVIEAGRIVTQAGPDVEDGRIVIEDGRIVAVGKKSEVEKPWDATVIGGDAFVAFPGFVEAHTSQGMDRANENIDVAPFLDIRDSVDPIAYYFEDCLRYGLTTINLQQGPNCVVGGRGMIVRPFGMTVEEMVVRPLYGMKISTRPKSGKSRATQMQALRFAFDDLRFYLEDLVEKEKDEQGYAKREALFQGRDLEAEKAQGRPMNSTAWKVEGLEAIPRGALDERYEPLLELMEGRYTAFFHCGDPLDVGHALDVARSAGILAKTVLVIEEDCWKAADLIAEAGVPVVLEGALVDIQRDPITGVEVETFAATVLQEKGVRFALSSEDPNTRGPAYQAALAIGRGLERAAALDAVTRVPAEILGLGNEVGSLEKGKLGNVLLFSGDPLSVTSWVEHVVLEGRPVYERAKDVRNKHLLEGVQPAGTAPPSVGEAGEDPEHKDPEHDDEKDAETKEGDGDEKDDQKKQDEEPKKEEDEKKEDGGR
jgi:imidazolonepropionase-like amidohydrolase